MAAEAVTFSAPNGSTDAFDGGTVYTLADRFTVSIDTPCLGVDWRVPDTLTGGFDYQIAIFDNSNNGKLRQDSISPTPGSVQRFLFGAAPDVLASGSYSIGVRTDRYAYSNSPSQLPASSTHISISTGALATVGSDAEFPTSDTGLNFHISPVVDDGVTATTATLDLTAPAATFTAAAAVTSTVSLAATAPAATLTAAATASATGALAAAAPAATFTAAAAAASTATLAATAPAARFTATGGPSGGRPVVTRPNTGYVTRPNTGYVVRP